MITSIEYLKKVKSYVEKELPPFADGTPFTAALKRPSIIDMVCQGRIANPLMPTINTLIGENSSQSSQHNGEENMVEALKFMETIAESCLVQPKLSEVKEYAGGLTDEQMFAIYSFAMETTNNLTKFCEVPTNS